MKFLTQNLHLKILAFFSAVLLWFFIVAIENAIYPFPQNIEVKAQNLPENLYLLSDLPEVKIYVKANQNTVKGMAKSDFEVIVDLKDLKAGEYKLPLKARSFNDNAYVLKIEPEAIQVKLEPVIEKEVKITTKVTGKPSKDFNFKSAQLNEQVIKIKGPEHILKDLKEVVAPVQFDGTQDEDYKEEVELKLPAGIKEDLAKNIILTPSKVEVTVDLEEIPEETKEMDQAQKTVNIKANVEGGIEVFQLYEKVKVMPATVSIKGNAEILKNVNLIETELIQLSWLQAQQNPVPVKLVLPTGVELVNPSQATVLMTLDNS